MQVYSASETVFVRFVTDDVLDTSTTADDGGDRGGWSLRWSTAADHAATPPCAPHVLHPPKWQSAPVVASLCATADLSSAVEAESRTACETTIAGAGKCEYVPYVSPVAEACGGTATNQVNTPVCGNGPTDVHAPSGTYGMWQAGSPEHCVAGTGNSGLPCTCMPGCTYTPPRDEVRPPPPPPPTPSAAFGTRTQPRCLAVQTERLRFARRQVLEACIAVPAAQAGVPEASGGEEFGSAVAVGAPPAGAGAGALLAVADDCPLDPEV